MTSKDSAGVRWNIIFLLILYLHFVTGQLSDDEAAPPCSPPPPQLPYSSTNSCPEHLISQIIDALACTPPTISPPPPPHDGGDLDPVADTMSDQEVSTETFAGVVVRAFSASREKEEGTKLEVLLILIFPVAVRAIFFPMRNFCPRFAQEQLIAILLVNAITAVLLPAEWMWVPALCCLSSLLILIVASRLR